MFHLAKWYLDLVTDDGVVLVGYSAQLRWSGVRLAYASILRSVPGQPPDETSAFLSVEPPSVNGDQITWEQRSLGVAGRWDRIRARIDKTLLDTPAGAITWTCVMPAARAQFTLNGARYSGIGYVEQLTLTIPPWDLPFNSLRWGRHASETHSVVWIAWSGADTRRTVWFDGAEASIAALEPAGVSGLRDDTRLDLGSARDLCARPPLARFMDHLPPFSRPVASRIAAMFEHKMVAPSRLMVAGVPTDSGWSVFEEVTW